MIRKNAKAILIFVLLVCGVLAHSLYLNRTGRFNTIASDAEGYYQYLPAVFIKPDIKHQPYSFYMEDGSLFNKYTCGVAMMQMPFFLYAHGITLLTDPDAATGYTGNYVQAIRTAAAFYFTAAIFFLYYFLRRYFRARDVIISLGLIYFGTNLYYYIHGEPGMSHVYSFFLFSAFIYYTPRFLEFRKLKYTILISLILAISVLLRPTNILIGLFILLYDVQSIAALRERFMLLLRNFTAFIWTAAIILLIYAPQMYYWNETIGKLFVNSYRYDVAVTGFINWRSPKILEVLAGHRSGWLLYTPIMLLALIGLVWIIVRRAFHGWAILAIFIPVLYLCASWSAYTFGWALGYRPFIELYAFLSIPFTFVIARVLASKSIIVKAAAFIFIANCVFLNVRFFQFYSGWDGPGWTWEYTGRVFKYAYYFSNQLF